LEKVRANLVEGKLDALLVSHLPNVQYLSGFSGSAGALYVTPREAIFFTDSRYDLQSHEEVKDCSVRVSRGDGFTAAIKLAARRRESRIGFEAATLSVQAVKRLKELLPGKKLIPSINLIENLRITKDPFEIDQIREAVKLGSRAYEESLPLLRPGVMEMEIAAEIEYRMRRYGGEKPSFETIVAFGERAALPHAKAGNRRLRPNEFILLDLGVILNGYCSDMTRTLFLGKAPRKAAEIYRAVLESQQEAEDAVRSGASCGSIDAAARRVLNRRGYGKYFTHSTGHGVGREIHEPPRIGARQKMLLPAGAVITVEPGVYIPGYGGVRIEDMVVVQDGGREVLTPSPKELMEL